MEVSTLFMNNTNFKILFNDDAPRIKLNSLAYEFWDQYCTKVKLFWLTVYSILKQEWFFRVIYADPLVWIIVKIFGTSDVEYVYSDILSWNKKESCIIILRSIINTYTFLLKSVNRCFKKNFINNRIIDKQRVSWVMINYEESNDIRTSCAWSMNQVRLIIYTFMKKQVWWILVTKEINLLLQDR